MNVTDAADRLKALKDSRTLKRDGSYLAADGGCGFSAKEIKSAPKVELEELDDDE